MAQPIRKGGPMSPLLISLGAGALIGVMYALLKVQSPAPPAVALVGLLGMVIGSALGGKLFHSDSTARVPASEQTQVAEEVRPTLTTLSAKQVG